MKVQTKSRDMKNKKYKVKYTDVEKDFVGLDDIDGVEVISMGFGSDWYQKRDYMCYIPLESFSFGDSENICWRV